MTEEPKLKEMRSFLSISQEMMNDAFPPYPRFDWRHPISSRKARKEWKERDDEFIKELIRMGGRGV
jgi:hypothetical protein